MQKILSKLYNQYMISWGAKRQESQGYILILFWFILFLVFYYYLLMKKKKCPHVQQSQIYT